MLAGRGLTRPAGREELRVSPPAQRRPMRMVRVGSLVPIDLPVDVIVVLEQQERAGQSERIERALRKH
jgi:hypothetical protein